LASGKFVKARCFNTTNTKIQSKIKQNYFVTIHFSKIKTMFYVYHPGALILWRYSNSSVSEN